MVTSTWDVADALSLFRGFWGQRLISDYGDAVAAGEVGLYSEPVILCGFGDSCCTYNEKACAAHPTKSLSRVSRFHDPSFLRTTTCSNLVFLRRFSRQGEVTVGSTTDYVSRQDAKSAKGLRVRRPLSSVLHSLRPWCLGERGFGLRPKAALGPFVLFVVKKPGFPPSRE